MGVDCWSLTAPDISNCGSHGSVTESPAVLALVLLIVSLGHSIPVKRSADAFGLADGDSEPVYAMQGFYGNPLYRPYGFGSFGWGSTNFMRGHTAVAGPNIYGGYYASG